MIELPNIEILVKCLLERENSHKQFNNIRFKKNFILFLKENKVFIRFFN